jgi:hypothetical protein
MPFVNALNKDTGRIQSVPANYVDNPHIFNGAFTRADAKPPKKARARKPKAVKAHKTSDKAEPADSPITDAASPAHATKE